MSLALFLSIQVEWLMNNKSLVKDSRISYFKNGNTHGIVIKASRTSDIGTYTCKASNHLGEVELHIELSGTSFVTKNKFSIFYHLKFMVSKVNRNPSFLNISRLSCVECNPEDIISFYLLPKCYLARMCLTLLSLI